MLDLTIPSHERVQSALVRDLVASGVSSREAEERATAVLEDFLRSGERTRRVKIGEGVVILQRHEPKRA